MEEDLSSMVLNGVNVIREEASDSNCSTHSFPVSKRERNGSSVSRRKFKGVVPQPNGNWGSQIYANHQRVWLGTFDSEKDAAMAYDRAAFKLRDGEYSQRNFPWTEATDEEPNFQNLYSTEAVINMIKNGTYQAKFADFLRSCPKREETNVGINLTRFQTKEGVFMKQLFHKELTPSDVSKLNRLVIPKKYAVEYFPCIYQTSEENLEDEWDGKANDVQLVFHDRMMSPWKFRYCYWSSSQSFVFTRGWNHFVKAKQLKANDTVTFYMCECKEVANEAQTFYMIDVIRGENNGGDGNMIEAANHYVRMQLEMKFEVNQKIIHHDVDDADDQKKKKKKLKVEAFEDDLAMKAKPIIQGRGGTKSKGFRLFGVQINII